MDNPWQLPLITIGPLLSQRFPLASAQAQPRRGLYTQNQFSDALSLIQIAELSGRSVLTCPLDHTYLVPSEVTPTFQYPFNESTMVCFEKRMGKN